MSEPNTAEPLLEFDDVTFTETDGYDHGLRRASFALRPGDCCLVKLEWESLNSPIADLACGIIAPTSGVVCYSGHDWQRSGFSQGARDRGRIGRTFEGTSWVGNLDVDENIILSERHHTWRADRELMEEAAALARAFGLQSLPHTRPAQTRRQDLARAEIVRAFMGSPKLLLLERPELGAFPDIMPALHKQIAAAREKGAAVLWMTDRPEIWQDAEVRPTLKFAMSGDEMVASTDGH